MYKNYKSNCSFQDDSNLSQLSYEDSLPGPRHAGCGPWTPMVRLLQEARWLQCRAFLVWVWSLGQRAPSTASVQLSSLLAGLLRLYFALYFLMLPVIISLLIDWVLTTILSNSLRLYSYQLWNLRIPEVGTTVLTFLSTEKLSTLLLLTWLVPGSKSFGHLSPSWYLGFWSHSYWCF